MNNIANIIKELRETSSTNDKLSILRREKDNELLQKVLEYTLNPFKKYGISEKNIKPLALTEMKPKDIFELLDTLANSNINDNLRFEANNFLGHYDEELLGLYSNIILKDLRIGMNIKSINKAYKGLLPEWNVQQAYPIDKYKLKKDEWIALSLKLNGIRSTRFCDEFKSRQNQPMLGLEHISQDLDKLSFNGFVFDGEMVRKNKDNIPNGDNFRLTTSILNAEGNNKSEIEFIIFDLLPKEEFIKGESKLTFKQRLEQLKQVELDINNLDLQSIKVAPTYYTGIDHSRMQSLLDEVDSKGEEGLMLLRDSPYKTKRHNGLLKCKKFKTSDCTIVGYESGTGRLSDTLGALVIDYKGTNVNVGSGYSDSVRKEIWDNRDGYIGRILEVQFKEETMDKKTKKVSLQFPTFICIREIGKEISYN